MSKKTRALKYAMQFLGPAAAEALKVGTYAAQKGIEKGFNRSGEKAAYIKEKLKGMDMDKADIADVKKAVRTTAGGPGILSKDFRKTANKEWEEEYKVKGARGKKLAKSLPVKSKAEYIKKKLDIVKADEDYKTHPVQKRKQKRQAIKEGIKETKEMPSKIRYRREKKFREMGKDAQKAQKAIDKRQLIASRGEDKTTMDPALKNIRLQMAERSLGHSPKWYVKKKDPQGREYYDIERTEADKWLFEREKKYINEGYTNKQAGDQAIRDFRDVYSESLPKNMTDKEKKALENYFRIKEQG